jgi:hypothetical protein
MLKLERSLLNVSKRVALFYKDSTLIGLTLERSLLTVLIYVAVVFKREV